MLNMPTLCIKCGKYRPDAAMLNGHICSGCGALEASSCDGSMSRGDRAGAAALINRLERVICALDQLARDGVIPEKEYATLMQGIPDGLAGGSAVRALAYTKKLCEDYNRMDAELMLLQSKLSDDPDAQLRERLRLKLKDRYFSQRGVLVEFAEWVDDKKKVKLDPETAVALFLEEVT